MNYKHKQANKIEVYWMIREFIESSLEVGTDSNDRNVVSVFQGSVTLSRGFYICVVSQILFLAFHVSKLFNDFCNYFSHLS